MVRSRGSNSFAVWGFVFSSILLLFPSNVLATALDDAAVVRTNVPFNTYMDGLLTTGGISQFSPYLNGSWYEFGAITGPIDLDETLVMEWAGYSPRNTVGFITNGGFQSVIAGSENPGYSAQVSLGNDDYTLALQTQPYPGNPPVWTHSSIDADNADGIAHIVGGLVDQVGSVTYHGITFDLSIGDYVLFMEDMHLTDGPVPSDRDYNDSVVVVRSVGTEVPEPASMLLLASGLLGMGLRRRKVS